MYIYIYIHIYYICIYVCMYITGCTIISTTYVSEAHKPMIVQLQWSAFHLVVVVSFKRTSELQDVEMIPVSVNKTLLLRKPLPCSPAAETALQALIWCSES